MATVIRIKRSNRSGRGTAADWGGAAGRALRKAGIEAKGSAHGAWRSPVSALVWETRGREFKSRRSDQYNQQLRPIFSDLNLPDFSVGKIMGRQDVAGAHARRS
jgi:hypothetical protein